MAIVRSFLVSCCFYNVAVLTMRDRRQDAMLDMCACVPVTSEQTKVEVVVVVSQVRQKISHATTTTWLFLMSPLVPLLT